MNKDIKFKELIESSFKGITPKYVEKSSIIVLNQKCIRNNVINYSLAQYHSDDKAVPENKFLKVGDILINSTGQGTAGRCAFVKELPENQLVTIDSHILVIRMSDFYTAGFAGYHLYNIEKLLQTFMDGSTGQGEFDKQRLYNVFVRLPSENSRKSIYELLSEIDKKIALNNQINATLEQMAKTLYDYWFVQFDFPDDNGKPYKSSGGEMVYNETLKRDIPKGWEVQNLSNHLKCNEKKLGKNHSLPFINYLDTSSLTNNQLSEAIHLVVGKDEIPSRANMVISHNDILYSTVRPNQNHFGFIKNPLENFIASTGFAVLSHKNNPNLNSIFYLFLTSDKNNKKLIRISETATSAYPSISPKDILNLQIALPSDNKNLIKMAEVFDSNFSKISINQKENQELTKLRDWLLPMLMNGQVTVQ